MKFFFTHWNYPPRNPNTGNRNPDPGSYNQCWGSVRFWCGSGTPDLFICLMDPKRILPITSIIMLVRLYPGVEKTYPGFSQRILQTDKKHVADPYTYWFWFIRDIGSGIRIQEGTMTSKSRKKFNIWYLVFFSESHPSEVPQRRWKVRWLSS